MRAISISLGASMLAIQSAAAQINSNARLVVEFDGIPIVSPSNPVARLELWAAWDPIGAPVEYLTTVALDLRISEPGLENAVVNMQSPSTWGTPDPLGYRGAVFTQIHIPSIGLFGNLDNPILLGTVDWRATDFSPRTVEVWTEDEDHFRVAGNKSGSVQLFPITSAETVITVMPCYADCDGSTTLDIFDFLCFQDAFIGGEPYADCDGNQTRDIFDFLCFQDAFVQGCP